MSENGGVIGPVNDPVIQAEKITEVTSTGTFTTGAATTVLTEILVIGGGGGTVNCGSGGGGYILGFTSNFEKVKQELSHYNLTPVYFM